MIEIVKYIQLTAPSGIATYLLPQRIFEKSCDREREVKIAAYISVSIAFRRDR